MDTRVETRLEVVERNRKLTTKNSNLYTGHLPYFSGKQDAQEYDDSKPIGRLNAAQTAKLLGFQEHEIPILISCNLLIPLAKPVPNAKKYFAKVAILKLANDIEWLDAATSVLYEHWQGKNASRIAQHKAETTVAA